MTQTPQHGDEKKAQVQDYFARTAESYVASFSHRTGDDLKRLIELGEWNPQQQALDIATGGGHTALAVAPHVARVVVTDLTPRMLEKAREFLLAQGVINAGFQAADAEHLPFADASFDRVTCRLAAHHFPNVAQSVKEVARVLKRGGLYLLIDCMDARVLPRNGARFLCRRACSSSISSFSARYTSMMIGQHAPACQPTKKPG